MPISLSKTSIRREADQYLDQWKKLWSVRDTAWHLNHRHPILVKYNDLLIGNDLKKRILFPLCGKNVDMKWFWERGHRVIGVECADQAIHDFFNTNEISFSAYLMDKIDAKLFETYDKRLNILQTNFLTLDSDSLNGSIDAVWDRGSFGTITLEEQILYSQTMRRLLAPDFRYLLLVLEFNNQLFKGPPFSVTEQRVHQMFGDYCLIERLESTLPEHLDLYQNHMKQELDVRETVYFLTDKNSRKSDSNNNDII